jgi:hypothetical protein
MTNNNGFVYYGYDPNKPDYIKIGETGGSLLDRILKAPKAYKFQIVLGFTIDMEISKRLKKPLLKAVERRAQFLLLTRYEGLYMPPYSNDWMKGDTATIQKINNEGGVEKAIYQAFIDTMPSLQGHIKVQYMSQGE